MIFLHARNKPTEIVEDEVKGFCAARKGALNARSKLMSSDPFDEKSGFMIALAHDERKLPRLMKNESLDKPCLSVHSSPRSSWIAVAGSVPRRASPLREGGRRSINQSQRFFALAAARIPSRDNVHNQLRSLESRDAVMKAVVLLRCSARSLYHVRFLLRVLLKSSAESGQQRRRSTIQSDTRWFAKSAGGA